MTARALMAWCASPGRWSAERLEVLGRDVLTLSASRLALRGNDIAMVLAGPAPCAESGVVHSDAVGGGVNLHQRLSRRARAEAVKDAITAVGLICRPCRYPGELPAGWDSG